MSNYSFNFDELKKIMESKKSQVVDSRDKAVQDLHDALDMSLTVEQFVGIAFMLLSDNVHVKAHAREINISEVLDYMPSSNQGRAVGKRSTKEEMDLTESYVLKVMEAAAKPHTRPEIEKSAIDMFTKENPGKQFPEHALKGVFTKLRDRLEVVDSTNKRAYTYRLKKAKK